MYCISHLCLCLSLVVSEFDAVEFGLMSTTTNRETALAYSGSGSNLKRATVFEIQCGKIDIGASLGFLSMYPGEEEYLMQPLCCLEVMIHFRFVPNHKIVYIFSAIKVIFWQVIDRPRIERTVKGEVSTYEFCHLAKHNFIENILFQLAIYDNLPPNNLHYISGCHHSSESQCKFEVINCRGSH